MDLSMATGEKVSCGVPRPRGAVAVPYTTTNGLSYSLIHYSLLDYCLFNLHSCASKFFFLYFGHRVLNM